MGLKQKYTEDRDILLKNYGVTFYVATYLNELPFKLRVKINNALENLNYDLFSPSDDYIFIGGVIKGKNPFFFSLAFLVEEGQYPYFVDIKQDTLDEYLDYVIAKQTIENYEYKTNNTESTTNAR
jgi:hypothetical protein